jgi:hypothetical protein
MLVFENVIDFPDKFMQVEHLDRNLRIGQKPGQQSEGLITSLLADLYPKLSIMRRMKW